jgi:hypothetical protein
VWGSPPRARARATTRTPGQVGAETFRLCRQLVDGVLLVDNAAISAAIKDVFNETRNILEPAGAVAVAGAKAWLKENRHKVRCVRAACALCVCGCVCVPVRCVCVSACVGVRAGDHPSMCTRRVATSTCHPPPLGPPRTQGKTVVAVTSGANINFERLRLVSELADLGASTEVRARACVLARTTPCHDALAHRVSSQTRAAHAPRTHGARRCRVVTTTLTARTAPPTPLPPHIAQVMMATTIPECPGAFKQFVEAATGGSGSLSVTEFKYRCAACVWDAGVCVGGWVGCRCVLACARVCGALALV